MVDLVSLLIPFVGALVGSGIGYFGTKSQIKSDEQQIVADYVIQSRIDAIENIHSKLWEMQYILGIGLYNRHDDTPGEYLKTVVSPELDDFDQIFGACSIHISKETEKAVIEAQTEYSRAEVELRHRVENEENVISGFENEEFNRKFRIAKEMLRKEMYEPINDMYDWANYDDRDILDEDMDRSGSELDGYAVEE